MDAFAAKLKDALDVAKKAANAVNTAVAAGQVIGKTTSQHVNVVYLMPSQMLGSQCLCPL